jgi:1-acyl-sn-glycerol-3-phosphate acyltransferase
MGATMDSVASAKKVAESERKDVPGYPAVIRNTAAVLHQPGKERKDMLQLRIPFSLLDSIYEFQSIHGRKTRTEAVIDLLRIALFVVEKSQELKDPAIVRYLQQNLYNLQIVDDIMTWSDDRVEAILGALKGEKDRRIRLKIGKARCS